MRAGTGPSGGIDDVAFSPDGKRLASTVNDGIWFWNPATGQPLARAVSASDALVSAFSPNGQLLATGDAGGIIRF
jgi:WD40 repeat protein